MSNRECEIEADIFARFLEESFFMRDVNVGMYRGQTMHRVISHVRSVQGGKV